jgi:hypothetical protein
MSIKRTYSLHIPGRYRGIMSPCLRTILRKCRTTNVHGAVGVLSPRLQVTTI